MSESGGPQATPELCCPVSLYTCRISSPQQVTEAPERYVEEASKKPPHTRLEAVAAMAAIAAGRDLKAASKAATALGYLAAGDRSPAVLEAVVKALLELSSKKGDELQFAVGEALCFAFGGGILDQRT